VLFVFLVSSLSTAAENVDMYDVSISYGTLLLPPPPPPPRIMVPVCRTPTWTRIRSRIRSPDPDSDSESDPDSDPDPDADWDSAAAVAAYNGSNLPVIVAVINSFCPVHFRPYRRACAAEHINAAQLQSTLSIIDARPAPLAAYVTGQLSPPDISPPDTCPLRNLPPC